MPRHLDRPALIDCHALRIGDLRRAGAIVQGEIRHGELRFSGRDGAPDPGLRIEFVADCRGPSGFLELRHMDSDHPAGAPYRVDIIEVPVVRRSETARRSVRYLAICPVRKARAGVLYCPVRGDHFASSRAHALLVESDRRDNDQRPLYRLQLARARLAKATAPKPPGRGKRGAEARTIKRLRAAVDEAEERFWTARLAKSQKRREPNEE